MIQVGSVRNVLGRHLDHEDNREEDIQDLISEKDNIQLEWEEIMLEISSPSVLELYEAHFATLAKNDSSG